jgi:parallel beta-helix repeat protein
MTRDRRFIRWGIFILAALFLSPIASGDIFLTVNGEDVNSILLPLGDFAYIDVHSDNFDSYVAYLYYGPTMGAFYHVDTTLEAGEYAYVEEGDGMFQIGTGGIEFPPAPGIHFTFEFEAPLEYEEFDVLLLDQFEVFVDSVHVTVMPAPPPDDEDPPEPNPMTWDLPPEAIGPDRITMTATTASDPSGVEYYFECISGGGHDSDWQLSPIYMDTLLLPSTQYTYRVKARDMSELQNETGWSAPAQATTLSRAVYVDDDAPADPGPGDPNISDPIEDGSQEHPFDAIQEAVDAAMFGDTVLVLDGTYTGTGNYDIDLSDRPITVRSQNGPDNCIIDGRNEAIIGFRFFEDSVEPKVDGFTIKNFHETQEGGGIAILCESSSPMIKNCIIRNNWIGIIIMDYSTPTISGCIISDTWGHGIYCAYESVPTIINCTIRNSSPGVGFWTEPDGTAVFLGTVRFINDGLLGYGTVQIPAGATLEMQDSFLGSYANLAGDGTVYVPFGKELVVKENAAVNLVSVDPNTKGTIQCDGLLRVTDNAQVSSANINPAFAIFEGNAVISENVITSRAGVPYGRLIARESAIIIENVFNANGDRYIDVNPLAFTGVIENNRVFVMVTEGINDTPPGLFELRGEDMFCCSPPCEPGLFPLSDVPDFAVSTWTIERLELLDGAKLTLTNRFDFQPPYDSGGSEEVIYIKHLILGSNSVLNIGFNRVYYQELDMAPTATLKDKPPMGFLLDKIPFDSDIEYELKIVNNNIYEPYPKIFVERVEGLPLDPTGMMRMRNLLIEGEPRVENARAKGLFAKSVEQEVLIRFSYLFETTDPSVGLEIYISDVPYMLAHDDPLRAEHYMKIGYLPVPAPGQSGSSDNVFPRLAVFQKTISTDFFDFREGMWIEVELIGPAVGSPLGADMGLDVRGAESPDDDGSSILIDDWGVEVHCDGICMDVNWDTIVSEGDFLTVIAACGLPASLDPNATDSLVCLDGFFSSDGFVDPLDIMSWDWAIDSGDSFLYYCGVPLGETAATGGAAGAGEGEVSVSAGSSPYVSLPDSVGDLLIAGKRSTSSDYFELKSKDRLYVFDHNGVCEGWSSPESDRSNIRVVKDAEDNLYQINLEEGVLRLDDTNEVIIPPGQITSVNDPRYNKAAVVYVGLQGSGQDAVGRPVFDAAFDDNYVYVVPVIVDPNDPNEEPYAAAAKLLLLESGNPPYQLMQLYDDPPPAGNNQYRNNLREIELDADGYVYIINAHSLNESDTLFKYDPNGTKIKSLSLGNPVGPGYLPDPIGMYVSNTTGMLYLASGQYNPADINSTIVHGMSLEDLSLQRSITVNGMHHVAGITEEPATGALWIVGFNMDSFPQWPNPFQPPFYHPCLAEVPYGSNLVQAESIYDPGTHDLALPTSIVWTRPVKCGGADIDGDGKVNFADLAVLGLAWLAGIGDAEWNSDVNISVPADAFIDNRDLAVLAEHWLENGCL